jgi:hypothetical protein
VKKEKANISGLKKTIKIPDFVSIKAGLLKKENEPKASQLNIGNDAVTVEELKAGWNTFTEKIKKEGRDSDYNTLNQQLEFNEDLSIKLTLANSVQIHIIEGFQLELLTFLRTNLNNGKIQLNIEVEKIEDKKMIYTNKEKFDYLAEKHPNLKELKQRLNLDTDF